EVAVVDAGPDRRLGDRYVQIVPAAVDDAVPVAELSFESRRVPRVDHDGHGAVIRQRLRDGLRLVPVASSDPDPLDPGAREAIRDGRLRPRPVSAEDNPLQRRDPRGATPA